MTALSWGITEALTAGDVVSDISGGGGGGGGGAVVVSRVEQCQFLHGWTEELGRV